MTVRGSRFVLIGTAGFALAACGAGGSGVDHLGSGSTSVAPASGPIINWDHPLANGLSVSLLAVSSAPASLGLSFTPKVPAFGGKLTTVDVTDQRLEPPQGRGVAFIYDYSGDPRFPGDGRVYISEQPARGTETDMEAVAAHPPGPPEDFSLQHIGGTTFLLVQDGGVGNAQFLANGVDYGVTGPAISPQVALDLASRLSQQAG